MIYDTMSSTLQELERCAAAVRVHVLLRAAREVPVA
jgi:hypothetical protein